MKQMEPTDWRTGGIDDRRMEMQKCLPPVAAVWRRVSRPYCSRDGLHFLTSFLFSIGLIISVCLVLVHPTVAVNTYNRLYAKGGRSFSVIDPDTMTMVWESGDAFEVNISTLTKSYFNSRGFTEDEYESLVKPKFGNQTLVSPAALDAFRAGTFDSMSPNLGCKPGALVLGMMNQRKDRYLFIALKNPSGIMVYNFTNPTAPTFKEWVKLPAQYLEPEAMHFTEAGDGDAPYLYVICGFSATLLLYQVNSDGGLTISDFYDGTTGAKPVPYGARLINGLTTYAALAYIPEEDSIYDVPMLLVANQYARRVDVFLINTTQPEDKIKRLGEIDCSTVVSPNGTVTVFVPGFPSDLYVQSNVFAVTVVPYDPLNPLTIEQQASLTEGSIVFYEVNVNDEPPFRYLGAAQTGFYPKKIVFAGSRFLVADYAKWAPVNGGADHIDPPGGVTAIQVPHDIYTLLGALREMGGSANNMSSYALSLQFSKVIVDEEIELPGTGLVASDPQPIDIAFSNDSNIAYVLLRSSNAIAVLNVTTMEFKSVHWLGAKNYSDVRIDASSKDGGINLRNFNNLFGLYMPSRLKVIPSFPKFGDREYIITVNEGEDTSMLGGDVTVKELNLDPGTFPDAEALKLPSNLGDLKVVRWKGLVAQLHTQLYDNFTRTAETPCNSYSFFQFQVNATDVCKDMRVKLVAMQGTPDVYVGKGVDMNPEIYDLTWSNYESSPDNVEDFVVSHLDPEFEPGMYYVGVFAYCEEAKKEAAIYNITISLELPGVEPDSPNDLLRKINALTPVGTPHYYAFCMNYDCAPVTVSISDCGPGANFCPEVLVSTSVEKPDVEDYTWKTMGGRRSITIAPEDPYNKGGVFYVAVVSRCVDPDPAKCVTPSPESVYNLTASAGVIPLQCPTKPNKVLTAPIGSVALVENVPVPQSTPCGQYSYFTIRVEDPCNDLVIETVPSCPTCGLPRVYVSKDYMSAPVDTDRTWTSSESAAGNSSVMVSVFDKEFSVGEFFVGVHADCMAPLVAATYSIVARFSSTHVYRWKNVTQLDMMNKKIGNQYVGTPGGYDYYHFCVRNHTAGDVVVTLYNCISPTACPTTYWWPEMLISKVRWTPTVNDRAWRLAQLNRNNITLRVKDPDVRPGGGHYFVGVYAWCNQDCNASQSQAGEDCAPCDNILRSPYNLSVQQGDSLLELVAPVPVTPLSPSQATASLSTMKGSAQSVIFSCGWKSLLWRITLAATVISAFVAPQLLEVVA